MPRNKQTNFLNPDKFTYKQGYADGLREGEDIGYSKGYVSARGYNQEQNLAYTLTTTAFFVFVIVIMIVRFQFVRRKYRRIIQKVKNENRNFN